MLLLLLARSQALRAEMRMFDVLGCGMVGACCEGLVRPFYVSRHVGPTASIVVENVFKIVVRSITVIVFLDTHMR